jgi:hypothetical protein
VNILKDTSTTINMASPSCDEFVINELISVHPALDNFLDLDCPPCTVTSSNCYNTNSHNSINTDTCDILSSQDLETELDCQENQLKIRVILKHLYPNRKLAVGVLLFEGITIRGFKFKEIITPPSPTGSLNNNCENVMVCKFYFELPKSRCRPANLRPKIVAHYTGFAINRETE